MCVIITVIVNETRLECGYYHAEVKKILKHDFGHFQSLQQRDNSTNRFMSYDFLLVFYSDLRSR